MLFETNVETDYHYADSIFEVAKRDIIPSKEWKNPCNAQHQQAFINVHNEAYGLTIANKGLSEYEVLRDGKNTIALTIHRGVRELGDWGVFLTPEAQCLGHQEVEFEIIPHEVLRDGKNTIALTIHRGVRELGDWGVFLTPEAQCLGHQEVEFEIIPHGDNVYRSYQEAYQYQVDWLAGRLACQEGTLPQVYGLFKATHQEVMPSALKVSELTGDIIGRWYNVAEEEATLCILDENVTLYETDLLEKEQIRNVEKEICLGKKEILTLGIKFN